jgi:hypothetical protein
LEELVQLFFEVLGLGIWVGGEGAAELVLEVLDALMVVLGLGLD